MQYSFINIIVSLFCVDAEFLYYRPKVEIFPCGEKMEVKLEVIQILEVEVTKLPEVRSGSQIILEVLTTLPSINPSPGTIESYPLLQKQRYCYSRC